MNTPKPRFGGALLLQHMTEQQANDRWAELQEKAKAFLRQRPLPYYALRSTDFPQRGGLYLITLKEANKKELTLFLSPSFNLREEVVTKRAAFIITKSGDTIQTQEGQQTTILPEEAFIPYIQQNCFIRFLVEENVKERLALIVAISILVKPGYLYN